MADSQAQEQSEVPTMGQFELSEHGKEVAAEVQRIQAQNQKSMKALSQTGIGIPNEALLYMRIEAIIQSLHPDHQVTIEHIFETKMSEVLREAHGQATQARFQTAPSMQSVRDLLQSGH